MKFQLLFRAVMFVRVKKKEDNFTISVKKKNTVGRLPEN